MRFINKLLIYAVAVGTLLLLIYSVKIPESVKFLSLPNAENTYDDGFITKNLPSALKMYRNEPHNYNIWCIFTKIDKNSGLKQKFSTFLSSLLEHSTVPLHLHIISDKSSSVQAEYVIRNVLGMGQKHKRFAFTFYDVGSCAEKVNDIVKTMMPHFSSSSGYYTDALFYISLGLYRLAPLGMDRAVIMDCDVNVVGDVKLLFEEFDKFTPETLFGLAPELSPVYRHVLYRYRARHPNTTFGNPIRHQLEPISDNLNSSTIDVKQKNLTLKYGFPGYNSGVLLLNLKNIHDLHNYSLIISPENVKHLVEKYLFHGHLGDQDFYTVLAFEFPHLFHTLSCVWNRQLCTWWKQNGYSDVFDIYNYCPGKIMMYHGNCNTKLPKM